MPGFGEMVLAKIAKLHAGKLSSTAKRLNVPEDTSLRVFVRRVEMANRWRSRAWRHQHVVPFVASMFAATMVLTVATQAVPTAAVAAPPPPPVAEPPRPAPPALTPAVEAAMQRDLHLDADRAHVRRAREAAAPDIEQSLRATLADGFGGAWLSGDEGTLNIGVTNGHDEPKVTAAGALPRRVKYSERQLNEAKAALDKQAQAAPDSIHDWYVDLPTNQVVITVQSGQIPTAKAYSAAAGVDARMVRVATASQRPQTTTDVRGGDGYENLRSAKCSIGFAVNGGFVTAGHCNTMGGPVFTDATARFFGIDLGAWQASTFPGNDYGWIKTSILYNVLPEASGLGSVGGSREAVVGTAVCRSGRTTGVRCGHILSKNFTANYPDGPVTGLTVTDACGDFGDSGGPYMAGDQAQGVASGKSGDCGSSSARTFFQPVNPILSTYGLTLKTAYTPTPWWDQSPGNSERPTIRTDVNGDGRGDVVTFYNYGNSRTRLFVFTANASGGFSVTMQWDSGPGNWDLYRTRVVGGDFNGDGWDDIAAFYDYGDGQTKIFVFRATTSGTYLPPVPWWDSGVGGWDLTRTRLVGGDFNGDTRDDIAAFYDYGGGHTRLWVFTPGGSATFTPTLRWDTGPGNWYLSSTRLAGGDFNGDTRDDIAAFYDYGGGHTRLWVFIANGTGGFTGPVMVWDTGPGNWYLSNTKLVSGDFNGDNRDDIVAFYDYGGGQTRAWMFVANGTGGFTGPVMMFNSGPGTWYLSSTRLVAGDYNGDRKEDVGAFYDYGNSQTRLWVFSVNSAGVFGPPSQAWDSGPGAWSMHGTVLV